MQQQQGVAALVHVPTLVLVLVPVLVPVHVSVLAYVLVLVLVCVPVLVPVPVPVPAPLPLKTWFRGSDIPPLAMARPCPLLGPPTQTSENR